MVATSHQFLAVLEGGHQKQWPGTCWMMIQQESAMGIHVYFWCHEVALVLLSPAILWTHFETWVWLSVIYVYIYIFIYTYIYIYIYTYIYIYMNIYIYIYPFISYSCWLNSIVNPYFAGFWPHFRSSTTWRVSRDFERVKRQEHLRRQIPLESRKYASFKALSDVGTLGASLADIVLMW